MANLVELPVIDLDEGGNAVRKIGHVDVPVNIGDVSGGAQAIVHCLIAINANLYTMNRLLVTLSEEPEGNE